MQERTRQLLRRPSTLDSVSSGWWTCGHRKSAPVVVVVVVADVADDASFVVDDTAARTIDRQTANCNLIETFISWRIFLYNI